MFLKIPNYPNYLLDTEKWMVFSIKSNRYIGSHKKNDDHISIELCCDGKVKSIGLHCLIYQICIGDIPDGYCVHHIDNNPLNNNPENLTLLSRKEHMSLHHKGKNVSESVRKKISESHKGKPSNFKGKHHTKEARRKLSESNKGKKHKPHYGVVPSTAFKQGNIPWNIKPIIALKDGIIVKQYKSAAAAKVDGFQPSKISQCCYGKRKTHKGHTFQFL